MNFESHLSRLGLYNKIVTEVKNNGTEWKLYTDIPTPYIKFVNLLLLFSKNINVFDVIGKVCAKSNSSTSLELFSDV